MFALHHRRCLVELNIHDIFLPLAVLCHSGCTGDLFINVLLTIFGYIPGVIHAIYVICIAPQQQQQGIVLTTNVSLSLEHSFNLSNNMAFINGWLLSICGRFILPQRSNESP
ncbi:unnamed protein product [Heligmosomoides polygyrus]|uniref:UPF0057-domain-containing protein n=1 Tax=Heligmosomoides polygyrus TaxID=6339 RepID=A0A183FE91_HELPZ|nr:unnamed protein product [Heligmosomoides polygyrus]